MDLDNANMASAAGEKIEHRNKMSQILVFGHKVNKLYCDECAMKLTTSSTRQMSRRNTTVSVLSIPTWVIQTCFFYTSEQPKLVEWQYRAGVEPRLLQFGHYHDRSVPVRCDNGLSVSDSLFSPKTSQHHHHTQLLSNLAFSFLFCCDNPSEFQEKRQQDFNNLLRLTGGL